MPFQMPQLQDNIGNALANIGQIRQQRTQNALAERQIGLSEAEGRRQQQQFDAEQAAAQRAQLVETTSGWTGRQHYLIHTRNMDEADTATNLPRRGQSWSGSRRNLRVTKPIHPVPFQI
mgnify:CR=1 FL=1